MATKQASATPKKDAPTSAPVVEKVEKTSTFQYFRETELLLRILILVLIYILAFAVRLFSVVKYESVIHEFDPYFNFRTTKVLVTQGFYEFLNWFDVQSWYPLGRIVGGTVYPGLMVTAGLIYNVLNFFNITVNIRNVCVLLAPWFSSNTALATYFLVNEVKGRSAALLAAAFISIVPSYMSRSVAGSYDNEGVAIFALVFTYALWIKAVRTGSILWSALASLSYFYMVAAWGGYVFIINLIPLYCFVMILVSRYSGKLYIAYTTFWALGSMMAMTITFVSFNVVRSSEHLASIGMFGFFQLFAFQGFLRSHISKNSWNVLLKGLFVVLVVAGLVGLWYARELGIITPWTGRFYSMFDWTYAKEHIPIIASVSEHQPTTWGSYVFDLHALVFLAPAGIYFGLYKLTDGYIFLIIYTITSFYFAGVMVRLMLVLAPIACIMSAIAISSVIEAYVSNQPIFTKYANQAKEVKAVVLVGISILLVFYAKHAIYIGAEMYSSPSIVVASQGPDGSTIFLDDFRGAYRWLNWNTPLDSRVMSWWDYGYQMTAMANRTVLVDNNTWNNTHIAQVGRAMSVTEDVAYPIMRALDVDYVLVVFGGFIGYSGDDINKFLWMVRISGGLYPEIKEPDYFTKDGQYKIDAQGSPVLLNSLMYKLCYYRFGDVKTDPRQPAGFDRVRNAEIGNKNIRFRYLEEVYTSEHWIVRIYKVKPEANRTRDYPAKKKAKKDRQPRLVKLTSLKGSSKNVDTKTLRKLRAVQKKTSKATGKK